MVHARFDDLTPGGEHAFELESLVDTVTATTPGEVLPALAAVDAASRRGLWAAGFVSYEAAPGVDPALTVADGAGGPPLVWFGLFRTRRLVEGVTPRRILPAPYHISSWRSRVDEEAHGLALEAIRGHIAAGDTYQVNHTFRLEAAFSGEPTALYEDLVLAQRGAFGAYIDLGRYRVVSASPELFFARDGDHIRVKPMKGTIRRGRWPEEDEQLAAELVASEKDRAENLMIVDLLRNDLGRIARFGTVEVDELFALERYETVWQLTSAISARIGDDATLGDVFTALFPSGSVTGAPKRRTMEIIVDLEESMRGVYCGAIGYVAPSEAAGPRAAFNVAIRTVVIDTEEGTAEYGVGGGITWDSLTAAEYQEARAKAQLLVERRPEFGLIETLRWSPDEGWLWRERHLERLVSSARYFGFLCDVDAVNAAMEASVDGATTTQRVRLVLGRGGELEVSADPLPVVMRAVPQRSADVLRFELSGDPVASDNTFVFHKTTRRGMYDDQLKAHPRADDVLLVNERGEITEFTIGNVVVCFGDRWVTPRLDSGCLPGVMRAELLAAGQVAEEIIEVADLDHADSIWFVNSVRGWRAAERISQNGW